MESKRVGTVRIERCRLECIRHLMVLSRRIFMTLWGTSTLGACGGSPDEANAPDVSQFPRYEGQLRYLFDDQIAPVAVGMALDGASAADDPLLRPRVEQAELVSRVRIQTLTMDVVGAMRRYTLTVQVGQPPLVPPKMDEVVFDVEAGPEQPAYQVLERVGEGLRGRTFVGLVRRFAGARGVEHHFHFTADVAEVHDAVRQISGLSALDMVPA